MADDKFMLIARYSHFCFDLNSSTMNSALLPQRVDFNVTRN